MWMGGRSVENRVTKAECVIRAAMLEHDGDWWLLYNKAVRMLWEAHLILHKAVSPI